MNQGTPQHPRQKPEHSQERLEALLREAAAADRFDGWVVGSAQAPIHQLGTSLRSGPSHWWLGFSSAAAAALAVGATLWLVRPATNQPVPGPIVRHESTTPAPVSSDTGSHGSVVTVAHAVDLSTTEKELTRWAFLDPGIVNGLPTLSDERSLVIAIYPNTTTPCNCLLWSVEDSDPLQQGGAQSLVSSALNSPCARDPEEGVVLVTVTGPRKLLPTHDAEAEAIASCLVSTPPDGADSWCADALAAAASAAVCLPDGLRVQATAVNLASR